jgi:hypothetical protein
LEAIFRKEPLDQSTIRRLLEANLITASDAKHFGTPPGESAYVPIGLTLKGHRLLDRAHNQTQKSKSKNKKRYQRLRKWLSGFEFKAVVGVGLTVTGLLLTYKYNGADDLRNKVYSPLNADMERAQSLVSIDGSQPFSGNRFVSLKQSGDFYRLPKSLQHDVSDFYDGAARLQGNNNAVMEIVERQLSSRISAIRTEDSDREWIVEAASRIRAQEQKLGASGIRSFSFSHAYQGRTLDVRDPNNPITANPGGPVWDLNDWLSYSNSLDKVSAMWTDDDFLYFSPARDLRYYRITRSDLQSKKTSLKEFLDPVYKVLEDNADFNALRKNQPELLREVERLKVIFAERMDSPKHLRDLLD